MPNPLNVLTLIPAKYRRYVYAVIALAAFLFGLWQAAEGDWRKFAGLLFTALVAATAHANTDTSG